MTKSTRKRRDRGAQFVRSNLELLGFGTRRDALVQAVKELFENGAAQEEQQISGTID
jgi:DNA topoisomerase VI subunit B